MATAPTVNVDICNLSLDHLKQAPISSIDTPVTTPETICARWYDTTRRELLRKHPWNFAIQRVMLPKSATAPVFGYSNKYKLPTDYLRFVTIGDDSIGEIRRRYEIENDHILTNADTTSTGTSIKFRYVNDFTSVSLFDATFIEAFGFKLAMNMAHKFQVSAKLKEQLKKDYNDAMSEARSIDGQERPPKRIQRSKLLAARQITRRSNNLGGTFTVFE